MTILSKRSFLVGLSLTALWTAQGALAQTATYPARPIRVIVPLPAGGAAGITMRLLGPKNGTCARPIVCHREPRRRER